MNALVYLLVVLCYAEAVVSNPLDEITPCKKDDSECYLKTIKTLYKVSVDGDPELGIEKLDPIHQDLVEMDISTLKYKLYDIDTHGFSLCTIENAKLETDAMLLHAEMLCPNLTMIGNYEADGQLLIMPIQGKGDCKVTGTNYKVLIDILLKKSTENGKTRISIKNFNFTSELLGDFSIYLGNLFNGQKELSDQLNKFMNENGEAVSKAVDGPVFNVNLKSLAKNLNKAIKYVTLDKLLIE